jgi:hypothetical protein
MNSYNLVFVSTILYGVYSDYTVLRAPATATPTPTPLNTAVGNYRWMDKKKRTVNNDSSMDDAPSAPLRVDASTDKLRALDKQTTRTIFNDMEVDGLSAEADNKVSDTYNSLSDFVPPRTTSLPRPLTSWKGVVGKFVFYEQPQADGGATIELGKVTRKNHDNTVNIWRHVLSAGKWIPLYWTGDSDSLVATDNAKWETSVYKSEIRSDPFELTPTSKLKNATDRLRRHLCNDLKEELKTPTSASTYLSRHKLLKN